MFRWLIEKFKAVFADTGVVVAELATESACRPRDLACAATSEKQCPMVLKTRCPQDDSARFRLYHMFFRAGAPRADGRSRPRTGIVRVLTNRDASYAATVAADFLIAQRGYQSVVVNRAKLLSIVDAVCFDVMHNSTVDLRIVRPK